MAISAAIQSYPKTRGIHDTPSTDSLDPESLLVIELNAMGCGMQPDPTDASIPLQGGITRAPQRRSLRLVKGAQ